MPGTRMWPMSPAAPWAPRWISAAGDDAAADAGADLDEQQVVGVAPVRPVLAEGHDVDVVVDEHRRRRSGVENQPGIEKPSQPGMIGGLTGCAASRTRPGPARRCRCRARPRRVALDFGEQLVEALVDPRRAPARGRRAMSMLERELGERRAGEVAHRQPRVRRAEVGDQHDAGELVEGEHVGGRPPVEALPPAS